MSKDIHGNSLYDKKYCQKMIDFFTVEHTITNSEGKEVANKLPMFEKFAVEIGVSSSTLRKWKDDYEDFSAAYKKCKDLQFQMTNDLAMRGFYNPTYTIFWAKNALGMKDKQEVENTGQATQVVYVDAETKKNTDNHIDEIIGNGTK